MNTKQKFFAAAFTGGLLSVSAFATALTSGQFEAPIPSTVVSPTGLARRHEGATVNLSLMIDANGRPHDIKVISAVDSTLADALTSAVAQWQFTPARQNGGPVATKVELPITLAEFSKNSGAGRFEAPVPTSVVNPAGLPRRFEGATVNLSLTVDANGQPHDIALVSPRDPALSRALLAAVGQWQFTPARKNGVPVSIRVELPVQLRVGS